MQNDLYVAEQIGITGHYRIRVINQDGTVDQDVSGHNTMCNQGMWVLANYLASGSFVGGAINQQTATPGAIYLALGTNNTTPAATDTKLTAEHSRTLLTATSYTPSTKGRSIAPTFSWFGALGLPATSWTAEEGGVFVNASATTNSGDIFDHFLVSPSVTQGTNQTLQIQVLFSL